MAGPARPRRRRGRVRADGLPARLPLGPARSWVERAVGDRSRVVAVERLAGGTVSVVQRIVLDTDRGRRAVVLRRIPPSSPAFDPPGELRMEERALALLERRGLADVPRVIAADPDGAAAGLPALLQTVLPGHPVLVPVDPDRWIRGLARSLADRLALDLDTADLAPHRDWLLEPPQVPAGTRDTGLWERVNAAAASPRPGGPPVLLHRDLHPGNVLWSRGRVSGVVDWVHLCAGPVEVDVSRCRVEVAVIAGRSEADALLAACRPLLPDGYDPRWDLVVCAELGPHSAAMAGFERLGLRLTPRTILDRLERVAATALAELG